MLTLSSQLPVPWKAFQSPLANPPEQRVPQTTSSHSLLSLAFNTTAQLEGFSTPEAYHGETLTALQLSGLTGKNLLTKQAVPHPYVTELEKSVWKSQILEHHRQTLHVLRIPSSLSDGD